jgi:hypothetical protein
VSSYQQRHAFFDDPRRLKDPANDAGAGGILHRPKLRDTSGLPPRTAHDIPSVERSGMQARTGPALCVMNERLEGFALCNLPSELGKPVRRAILTADGGRLTGMQGEVRDKETGMSLDVAWRWDPSKQRAGTPPKEAVSFPLNDSMSFLFESRRKCTLRFSAGGVSLSFDLSEHLRRPPGTSYLDLSSTTAHPTRPGQKVLALPDRVPLAQRPLGKSKGQPSKFRIAAVASLIEDLTAAMSPVVAKAHGSGLKSSYVEAGWKEAALARTLREAPMVQCRATGTMRVAPPADSLTRTLAMERTSKRPDHAMGSDEVTAAVLRLTRADIDHAIEESTRQFEAHAAESRRMLERDLGLTHGEAEGGMRGDVAESLDRTWGSTMRRFDRDESKAEDGMEIDGYGGVSGASRRHGQWLTEMGTRRFLETLHPALDRSGPLSRASGTYRDAGMSTKAAEIPFRQIPAVPSASEFDRWIEAHGAAYPEQLVVVACVRNDESACRRAFQTLSRMQATLGRLYPASLDFASDPLISDEERAAMVAQAEAQGVTGVGSSGREAPILLRHYPMDRDEWMAKRYAVWSLPLFLAFWRGSLVYRGVLGGADIVKLPGCNRPCNVLLVEPSPRFQRHTEQVLRTVGLPWVLASGKYDPARDRLSAASASSASLAAGSTPAGGVVGIADEASRRLTELANSSREAALRAKSAAIAHPSGTDATTQSPDDFSLVMIASEAGHNEAALISATVSRLGGGRSSGRGEGLPGAAEAGIKPALCGRSLLVSMLPCGAVLPGSQRASLPSSRSAGSPMPSDRPWVCPRTNIVVGATEEHCLGGVASVAVVRPLKRETFVALRSLWRACVQARGETTHRSRGAAQAAQARATSISSSSKGERSGPLLPGQSLGPEGDGDGVHLGMTHNDLIERLWLIRQAAAQGKGTPATAPVLLSASETVVRGTPLNATVL